ncbi:ATP-dependent RNA helicase RhlE [Enhygromyxa salina]|uniref:DEAD-box ATP-dependent RNA helicase RhpA n=1 Tax=Enhygromyxa salina TaxID=215803 RepID=A0A2S9Y1P8_9BACT|nr:DEAD/DEAH box helicase [Enhygromyxa salina]PRP99006.1 ATP-dependent RNA helicase RhlE [Enhygromyxa salina]
MNFDQLGLVPPLLRAVRESGYKQPTPIQTQAIPPALARRDILGCAQTGTGKTAAFALPILQHLDASADDEPALRALIVTPTRELAAQIGESFATYGEHLELWHTVIFGGVNDKPQIRELRKGVDAIVATPGRLLDLMSRGEINLSKIEVFVLDEADQMLDMGFLPDIRRIVAKLPTKRQTLFFSATMPDSIRTLAATLLHDPIEVAVARVSEPADVDQQLYFVDKANKRKLLVDLLQHDKTVSRSLVFSRTKHGANRIAKYLSDAGVGSAAIHGNKSQGARTRALDAFRKGDLRVLVATDIAARGLDIDSVSHVINFDLPNVPETYIHRIGRTARAGASGIALSFCDIEERPYLADIERLLRCHIDRVEDHAYPPAQALPGPTDLAGKSSGQGRGGGGGRGPSRNKPRRGKRSGRRPRRPQ